MHATCCIFNYIKDQGLHNRNLSITLDIYYIIIQFMNFYNPIYIILNK